MLTLLLMATAVGLVLVSAMGCAEAGGGTQTASTLSVKDQTPIAQAFEKGLRADRVQLAPDGKGVVLYDLTLAEDDGPGSCGASDYGASGVTTLRGDTMAKKVLVLERGDMLKVHVVLCVRPRGGETAPLEVKVNGRRFSLRPAQVKAAGDDWPAIEVPASLIRQGENEIQLSCAGQIGWLVVVAPREHILRNAPERKDRPNRSFRSTDAGQIWSANLADEGTLDGEFMVRLHVDQYVAQGELIGPVIDLWSLAEGASALPAEAKVKSLRLRVEKKIREGTKMEISARCGDSPVYDPASWGEWIPCSMYGNIRGDLKRFVQWRAVLASEKGKASPILESVEVQAELRPTAPAWAAAIRPTDSHNEEILYTSIPFEYEKFDEPALVELRAKYKLDEVVAGAASEIEKMIRLRSWLCSQWKYDPPVPNYPAWDAREILERRTGFCVQYAIAYMQCALSLGLQTRFVFGKFPNVRLKGEEVSGHEVTEVWSNDLGEWIMMDPQRDESFVSRKTGRIAGMMELHEDQINTYSPAGLDAKGMSFEEGVPSDGLLWWKGLEPTPRAEKPVLDIKWGYLFWMPRNNFYAHRFPEPIQQGRGWCWTGYWLWQDARTPRQWRFGQYTRRLSDMQWTINQVRWAAAPAKTPGTVGVTMGTVTPDLETFEVSIDGGLWQPSVAKFEWRLHPGKNRVEMRIRTRSGILGRKSWIELDYTPAA
jgi:hypothetical protein